MTTAKLSVGIDTSPAKAELAKLRDELKKVGNVAIPVTLDTKGLTNLKISVDAASLKTLSGQISKAVQEGLAGINLGGIKSKQIEADLKLVKQAIVTAANDVKFGDKIADSVKQSAPKTAAAAKEAGKQAGKAFAEGEAEGAKTAKISYRFREGAGSVSISDGTKYTVAEVKARAEAAEADRLALQLQKEKNQQTLRHIDHLVREYELKKKTAAEELKAFYAAESKAGTAEMKARAQAWTNVATEAAKAEKAQRAAASRLFAEGKNLAPDSYNSKQKAVFGASYAVQRGVSESMLPNGAAGLLSLAGDIDNVGKKVQQLGNTHKEATTHTKTHAAAMRDAHSAARGLASGFGLIWLTWGNIAPLLAGASLSHGFMQAMKAGSEFAYQLTFVKALGGETAESVRNIGAAALEMSKNGLYGPVELANGLRVLNQAGISTKDSMMALPQVFDLATVGEMNMKDAAITLAGVMTAFNLQVQDMSYIGDVFAKAAAVSQTSVEQMTQAMKTASVVGDQYGASMEDTATALTLLAKVNITGTAAGTSLRNMLKELYSPTDKAERTLKMLGVTAQTANGQLKSFPDIIYQMKGSLEQFNRGSQIKILQDMFGERGAKEAIAMLSLTRAEWDKLNETIRNSGGFMAEVSSQLEATTKGSFKQAVNTLQSSLIEAFEKTEGSAQSLAAQLKNTFGSAAFKETLDGIVGGVLKLTNAFVFLAPALATVAAGWVAMQGVVLASSLVSGAIDKWTKFTAAVNTFGAVAQGVATTAGGATGLRAAVFSLINPITAVVTVVGTLTAALGYLYSKLGENTYAQNAINNANNIAESMVNLRNKIAAAVDEQRRLNNEKGAAGGSDVSAAKKMFDGARAETAKMQAERDALDAKIFNGGLTLGEAQQLNTLNAALKVQSKKLAEAEKSYEDAKSGYSNLLQERVTGALLDSNAGLAKLPSNLTAAQKAAKAEAEFAEEYLRTNAKFIAENSGEQATYILRTLSENLAEKVQAAKAVAGTREYTGTSAGGGRAAREAGKYEKERLQNVLKDQTAIERLYDAHYKRLLDVENASAQAGLITREQAEVRVAEITEEQTKTRITINENFHNVLKDMLKTSGNLTAAQREQIEGELERRGLSILQLQEELELKRELAKIASAGYQKRFDDGISKTKVEIEKAQKAYELGKLGDGLNGAQRSRAAGALLVEEKYAQQLEAAKRDLDTATYGGDADAIKAAQGRLDTLTDTIAQAKQASGDLFVDIYEKSQSAEYGWNKFWNDYEENATTAAKVVEQSMTSVTKNLEDAFANVFETGKFDAKKMFNAILADVGKLTAKLAVSDLGHLLFGKGQSSGNVLGSLFGDGKSAANTGVTGMGTGGASSPDLLTQASNALKGFWGALTGSTSATEDSTAKTVEGVAKTVLKTTAESSTTSSLVSLASAAQMAATALATVGTTTGGSGGIGSMIGSLFGGSGGSSAAALTSGESSLDALATLLAADGAAFSSGGIKAFAKGGAFTNSIVSQPTMFRFADGVGLMGEAGAEAIMPLGRDSQGRLGVRFQGKEAPQHRSSNTVTNNNINVSINSKGGDPAEIKRAGASVARQVGAAVANSARFR